MKNTKALIFIPTYNELGNVEKMFHELNQLNLSCDILFIDDNSPDGTGSLLDNLAKHHSNLTVIHRNDKQGIGSAHLVGITYAYEQHYTILITMDSDFTHHPSEIPRLIAAQHQGDVIIGSRYLQKSSLSSWGFFRLSMTYFAHFLTKYLLGLQQDASSGLRLYHLNTIPLSVFKSVQSKSYSFFFESLFLLKREGYTLSEIPIDLPARARGQSKMNMREAFCSGLFLLKILLYKNYFFSSLNKDR